MINDIASASAPSIVPPGYGQNTSQDGDSQTPREKTYQGVLKDLRHRTTWENKYVDFYRMRHTGIRRKQKPWANAADLHFPLIDTNIEKLKPMFFQQIVGMDNVATFVPMKQQSQAMTTSAANLFDYKVREKTNLQDEALSWIDYALMSGRGVMKVTWNPDKKQVEYAAVSPLYIIVPSHTKQLQDADRIVHVMPMSVAAYERCGLYKADKATLDKIKSNNADNKNDPGQNNLDSAKRLREGLTHDSGSDRVIVWEVYTPMTVDGAPDPTTGIPAKVRTWKVETFSPSASDLDLRETMQLPYDHNMAPFVDFPYEIKDTGWHSPRGVAEILSPFEAALCHTWNQKHDTMQLFNKPMFSSSREMPNTMNLRASPGQILPFGISPVQAPQPPISFDQEMQSMRGIAEQRVSNPDYGLAGSEQGSDRRTATEINAIGGQSQQASDLRQRILRMALAKLYKMTWSIYLQYDATDLMYRIMDDIGQAPPEAMHELYHIEPKGGVNEVNRQMLLQKAVQRKQLFAKSPWINQPELDKSILELDDPSLIKRVFQDPQLAQKDEVADEQKTIPALLVGANVQVKQGQNYAVRVGVLMGFLQQAVQLGQLQALPPIGKQAIVARLDALLKADAQVDNNGAKQLSKEVADFLTHNGLMPAPQPMAPGMPPSAAGQPPMQPPALQPTPPQGSGQLPSLPPMPPQGAPATGNTNQPHR